MSKIDPVKIFLRSCFTDLHHVCNDGASYAGPEYELTPFDYLDFAERSLVEGDECSQINCIAHLKRAAECQLDTFIYVMNLTGSNKNFPSKLNTVGSFGLLSPRNIGRLNQLRNKLEHEYARPEVSDLEVYFELVSGFVHALEMYLLFLRVFTSLVWENEELDYKLSVSFDRELPKVSFVGHVAKTASIDVDFTTSDGDDWSAAVRIYFLLCRSTYLVHPEYVLKHLDPKPQSLLLDKK